MVHLEHAAPAYAAVMRPPRLEGSAFEAVARSKVLRESFEACTANEIRIEEVTMDIETFRRTRLRR